MKEKLKKLFSGNGSLTLLSLISLFLVFALVCGGVLFAVYEAGIIDSPFAVATTTPVRGTAAPPSNAVAREELDGIDTLENLEGLLAAFPYYDDFFAEFYITYAYESYNIEFYRIYRHGKKYRIEIYDAYDNMKKKIVCDGARVVLTDYISASDAVYALSEEFSFERQAPLPSFALFKDEEYRITSFSESGDRISVRCDFPTLAMYDIVTVDLSTGIMEAARTYFGGQVVMFYDIRTFETEYLFNELLFLT